MKDNTFNFDTRETETENHSSLNIKKEKKELEDSKVLKNNKKQREPTEDFVISRMFEVSSSNALQAILRKSFDISPEDIKNLKANLNLFLNVSVLNSETIDSSAFVSAVYRSVSNRDMKEKRKNLVTNTLGTTTKFIKIAREIIEKYSKLDKKSPTDSIQKKIIGGFVGTIESILDVTANSHMNYIKNKFSKAQIIEKNILKTQKTIFEAKCYREKITLLSKYVEEMNKHIEILNQTEYLDDTDINNKLEKIKSNRKNIYNKLTDVIAKASTLHEKLSSDCETNEDKELIKKLFDTGLNIKPIPIEDSFIGVVKIVLDQINKDALMLDANKAMASILNQSKIDTLKSGTHTTLAWNSAKETLSLFLYFLDGTPASELFKITFALKFLETGGKIGEELIEYNHRINKIKYTVKDNTNAAFSKIYSFLRHYMDMIDSKAEIENIHHEMLKGEALKDIKNADEIYEARYNFFTKILEIYTIRESLVTTYLEVLETVNLVESQIEDKADGGKKK